MKTIKIIGLAALTVLALTALSGVASASGTGFFEAGEYPATVSGTYAEPGGEGELGLWYDTGCLSPELSGSLGGRSKTLTTTATYRFCGIQNMNGCQYVFHPPTEGINGTFDIGGSECKGILGEQNGIHFVIPAQTGLAATFENQGSGNAATVTIHAQANSLKYEVTTKGKAEGPHTGFYHTIWTVKADSSGRQVGFDVFSPGFSMVTTGGQEKFHAGLYPATIGGEQTKGHELLFTTVAGEIECATGTYSSATWAPGGLTGDTGVLGVSPSYGGCTLAGLAATVTGEAGCADTFNSAGSLAGYLGVCGIEIQKTGSPCKVTLLPQARPGLKFTNVGAGNSALVEASANLSGVEYRVTEGKKCPNKPADGVRSDGKVSSTVALRVTEVN